MNIVLVVPAVLFVTPLASRLSITCWDSLEVYAFMKHVDTLRLLSSIGNEEFIQYSFRFDSLPICLAFYDLPGLSNTNLLRVAWYYASMLLLLFRLYGDINY